MLSRPSPSNRFKNEGYNHYLVSLPAHPLPAPGHRRLCVTHTLVFSPQVSYLLFVSLV